MSSPEQPFAPPEAEPAPPAVVPPPAGDLKKRVVRATVVSLLGTGGGQFIRLAANLAVSRLLSPEAYGLMALVITLDIGLQMVSDLGTRLSIVQNKRGDEPAFLNTAFTIELLRGTLMWLLATAAAWPFAWFYNDERLKNIVLFYAITALLNGANSTKVATLNRHMRMEGLVLMELASIVASSIFTVVYAYFVERSVWALVYGSAFGAVTRLFVSHFALEGPLNRLHWDRDAVRSIFSFGGWIFVSTLITFFAQRLDVLMMGTLFALDVVGVYNNSNNLSSVPMMLGGRIIGNVLLPALAEAGRDNKEALGRAYDRGMDITYMAGGLVCVGVALIAPAFYSMWDARYHDAGWIAQLLMLVVWFGYTQEAAGRALQALGDARSLALVNAVKLVVTAGACYLGFHIAGLPGFMLGAALGAGAGQATVVLRLRKQGLAAGRVDLKYTSIGLVFGLVGTLVPRWLAQQFGWNLVVMSLVASVVLGGPLTLYVGRKLYKQVKGR